MPPELVDSHCHLDFPGLAEDVENVIRRARDAGVTRLVHICLDPAREPWARELAATHEGIFYAYGVHPMDAAKRTVRTEDLVAMARAPKCVGLGETGLDYHYEPATAAAQQAAFRCHIEAARETGLPIIVHARDADEDIERILSEEWRRAPFSCVMHCFASGERLARAALDMGFYLSMSGITAFRRSDALRAIFAAAPRDRILVETDSPYLAPPPMRGKQNEPAYVVHTARRAAALFDMTEAEFAALTSANFERLFTRAAASADGT